MLAGGGVDALDPEAAHVALAVAAITVGIDQGVDERLARRTDERRSRSATAFGLLQEPLVAAVRGDAALDACHRLLPLARVRHEPLELAGVGVGHAGHARVTTRATARLDLEVMAAPGLRPDPLPGAGLSVALGRPLVGLHFRHGYGPCCAGA